MLIEDLKQYLDQRFDAIEKDIDEIKTDQKEMRADHRVMQREFYLFKGKFTTITAALMFGITVSGDYIKKKLGL